MLVSGCWMLGCWNFGRGQRAEDDGNLKFEIGNWEEQEGWDTGKREANFGKIEMHFSGLPEKCMGEP